MKVGPEQVQASSAKGTASAAERQDTTHAHAKKIQVTLAINNIYCELQYVLVVLSNRVQKSQWRVGVARSLVTYVTSI